MAYKDLGTLRHLEQLLDEFFSSTVTNERRQAIQNMLDTFRTQPDAWKLCIYFIENTTHSSVSQFALSEIEAAINLQWHCLTPVEQDYIKNSLLRFTMQLNSLVPHYLIYKLAKVLVLIGKQKWPKDYNEHYNMVMELLHNEDTRSLGLILLQTTSEEILSPTSNVSSNHKDILCSMNAVHIPQIFQALTVILEGLSVKWKEVTAPPSSPTHNSFTAFGAPVVYLHNVNMVKEILNVLHTLEQLFSWVTLTLVPHELIAVICKFIQCPGLGQDEEDVSFLAISVINEIMYRKCVPPQSHGLFMQLYTEALKLMRQICVAGNVLPNEYIEKIAEMLGLLVQHFWRLETNADFNPMEMLSYLYQFTMGAKTAECYMGCLSIWEHFLKQIKPHNMDKYSEPLAGLVIDVINKMQFLLNFDQLHKIDDRQMGDDQESDWGKFQTASINIIELICDLSPAETFERVLTPWRNVYSMLHELETENGVLKYEVADSKKLLCALKDMSTLTQTLARITSPFMCEDSAYFKQAAPIILSLIGNLIENACLSSVNGLSYMKIYDKTLIEAFTEMHSVILSVLKTWLGYYILNSATKSEDLCRLLRAIIPILRLSEGVPMKVSLSAAHLLYGITAIIQPKDFLQVLEAQEFIHVASSFRYIQSETRNVVLSALAMFLLKSWGELDPADDQQRVALIGTFFDSITCDYRNINLQFGIDSNKCLEISTHCLPCLSVIIDNCADFPTASKRLLYDALQSTVEHTLNVYSAFTKVRGVNEMQLQFFYKMLEWLHGQVSTDIVNKAVQTFLDVAIKELEVQEFGSLEALLKMLKLVIETPGSVYKHAIPGILSLCAKHVYPTVMQNICSFPDAAIALVNLLHSILLNHWALFSASQVRLGYSPSCSGGDAEVLEETPEQNEQLLQILQVFGQCLMQSDLNAFRTSLCVLEHLNAKWNLYHKPLFKEQLLCHFLTALLQTLLDKTHTLLEDEIVQALYNMVSVGFDQFYGRFLNHFLETTKGLSQQQRAEAMSNFVRANDMPTFVQNLHRFINDVRCSTMYNSIDVTAKNPFLV